MNQRILYIEKILTPSGNLLMDKGGAITSPTQGNRYFVRPSNGDDKNDGLSPASAFKTLLKAKNTARANQNDIIFLMAESDTAANTTDYQAATLTWDKDLVHLVGIGAPTAFSNRARIAQKSTATALTQLMSVTANGCQFSNVSIIQAINDATSLVALKVTGERNVFDTMHIAGIGHATQVTAGAKSLQLSAANECVFRNCTIGLDTIARDNTVTEIGLDTAAVRNLFENCHIVSYLSNAGFAAVTIGTNGNDRSLRFKDCLFGAKSSNKTIQQTSVFSIPAISQGAIILQNTYAMCDGGAPNWDSNSRGIIFNTSPAAAASAAGGYATSK